MSEQRPNKSLKNEFIDEEYAQSYTEEFLNFYLATQIRVLREQRGWTQKALARKAGMKQTRISKLEDVNYNAWSLSTLRRLARAFDLTLSVSFETFTRKILDISHFSREGLLRRSRIPDLTATTFETLELVRPTTVLSATLKTIGTDITKASYPQSQVIPISGTSIQLQRVH